MWSIHTLRFVRTTNFIAEVEVNTKYRQVTNLWAFFFCSTSETKSTCIFQHIYLTSRRTIYILRLTANTTWLAAENMAGGAHAQTHNHHFNALYLVCNSFNSNANEMYAVMLPIYFSRTYHLHVKIRCCCCCCRFSWQWLTTKTQLHIQ